MQSPKPSEPRFSRADIVKFRFPHLGSTRVPGSSIQKVLHDAFYHGRLDPTKEVLIFQSKQRPMLILGFNEYDDYRLLKMTSNPKHVKHRSYHQRKGFPEDSPSMIKIDEFHIFPENLAIELKERLDLIEFDLVVNKFANFMGYAPNITKDT